MHITVIGGGPVGMLFALSAAQKIPFIEQIVLCQSPTRLIDNDPRILAINQGSLQTLSSLGVHLQQCAPIQTVHVSQKGHFGKTTIRHTDYHLPHLGQVTTYSHIFSAIQQVLAKHPKITLLQGEPAFVQSDTPDGCVIQQGEQTWATHLCVQAEGGTYDTQSPSDWHRDYQQTALLSTVTLPAEIHGHAFERFTAEGPIALLPHPNQQPHQYGLIWCVPPANAAHIQQLPLEQIGETLTQAFGSRLGNISVHHPLQSYVLGANFKQQIHEKFRVSIGNAAQTLHPVSGQGLNLGVRDAMELVEHLRWHHTPVDVQSCLRQFARHRQTDRVLARTLTDILPRFFSQHPLLRPLGGIGLVALDLFAPARHLLADFFLFGYRK